MHAETAFVLGYGSFLVLLALVLDRVGHLGWRQAGTGKRGPPGSTVGPTAAPGTWPHSEVPRLHTVVAVVASSATAVLCTVEVVRHHRPVEALALTGLAALSLLVIARLARALGRRPYVASPIER